MEKVKTVLDRVRAFLQKEYKADPDCGFYNQEAQAIVEDIIECSLNEICLGDFSAVMHAGSTVTIAKLNDGKWGFNVSNHKNQMSLKCDISDFSSCVWEACKQLDLLQTESPPEEYWIERTIQGD